MVLEPSGSQDPCVAATGGNRTVLLCSRVQVFVPGASEVKTLLRKFFVVYGVAEFKGCKKHDLPRINTKHTNKTKQGKKCNLRGMGGILTIYVPLVQNNIFS